MDSEDTTYHTQNARIAMLIDGDNAQPTLINHMLAEAGKYGMVTIRRIYGDWTTSNMSGWKDTLQTYAIQPIQQFRYTIGKNATDSAMIIDAMDILYQGGITGFCLVSSDSDYTRLATRIREMGIFIMGIGKKTTPRAFVNACEVFVFTDNLIPPPRKTRSTAKKSKTKAENEKNSPIPLLRDAYDMAVQENGWAFLGAIGNYVRQLDPSFDARTYGHTQLSSLIREYPELFELKDVKRKDGTSIISVKLHEE